MSQSISISPKNALLELVQSQSSLTRPEYFHFDYGPDHSKVFCCICIFDTQVTSQKGRTKVEAEQLSSEEMLKKIQDIFQRQIDNKGSSAKEKPSGLPTLFVKKLENLTEDIQYDVLSLYGDALFRYMIAHYLFETYPEFSEGIYTLIVSEVVRAKTREKIAENLGLEPYVRSQVTSHTLACAFSAVLGKLHLEASSDLTRKLILDHSKPFIDHAVGIILKQHNSAKFATPSKKIFTTINNYKNQLQEYAQKNQFSLPRYVLLETEGIDHAPKFTVACTFREKTEIGEGSTVKSAEQMSAKNHLERFLSENLNEMRVLSRSKKYSSSLEYDSTPSKYFDELKSHLGLPNYVSLKHLKETFTHQSENGEENFERLEFLGDSVLRMLIIEYLLSKHSKVTNKSLITPLVDWIVSAETQLRVAKKLNIDKYIISSAFLSDKVVADVLEALIATVYIDSQRDDFFEGQAVGIIIDWFKGEIETGLKKFFPDQYPDDGAERKDYTASERSSREQNRYEDHFPTLSSKPHETKSDSKTKPFSCWSSFPRGSKK